MDAIAKPRSKARQRRDQAQIRRSDQEFLAPELEILETPASPLGGTMILVLAAFAITAIAWAYIGHIDIVATAQGKIEPIGKVKVIQPLLGGKVGSILVHDGDTVRAGDSLVELDAKDARTQLDDASEQLTAAKAEALCRQAGIAAVEGATDTSSLAASALSWPADVPVAIQEREQGVLEKDLDQLRSELAGISSQIDQKNVDLSAVAATISAQQDFDATLESLASMRETLLGQGSGSKADWLSALELLKAQQVTLTADLKEKADDAAAIPVLENEGDKARGAFLADYSQKLAAAEERADELAHKVSLGESQLAELTLRSPIDGIVEASSITTLGQVVTAGSEVMRIVPDGGAIDVVAFLPNEDVGFVAVGQQVQVKIAAFPFTRYGAVSGKIVELGRDALAAGEAGQDLADPSHSGGADSGGLTSAGQQLVFPIRVELDARSIQVDAAAVPLQSGMSVSVDINTGSRRILDYLLSPMEEVGAAAMRER